MKKVLAIFFTFAVISTFANCSSTEVNSGHVSSEASAASQNTSTHENNKNQTEGAKEKTEKNMGINITIGNKTFTASLEDNDTAKAFAKQLPLTVNMAELHRNEKYNNLTSNLCADKSSCPGRINEGDLMLYGNSCLVLFYKRFNTSYSYVKIGHIENTKGLNETLGSGSVKVTFSASE